MNTILLVLQILIISAEAEFELNDKTQLFYHQAGSYVLTPEMYGNAKYLMFEIVGAGGSGGKPNMCEKHESFSFRKFIFESSDESRTSASDGGGSGAYAKVIIKTFVDQKYQSFNIVVGRGGLFDADSYKFNDCIFSTNKRDGGSSLLYNIVKGYSIDVGGGKSGDGDPKGGIVTFSNTKNHIHVVTTIDGASGLVPSNFHGDTINLKGGHGGSAPNGGSGGRGAYSYKSPYSKFKNHNLAEDGTRGGGGGGGVLHLGCGYVKGGNGGDGFVSITPIN